MQKFVRRGLTRTERHDDERGFTLLELMVVVLIIGILLAFAIPQFLKARSGSQEKQAQSNVRVALSAAAQYLEDHGNYENLDATTISEYENSVQYAAASDDSGTIGVVVNGAYTLDLVARSDSGYCYYIQSIISDSGGLTPGTLYGVSDDGGGDCAPDIASATVSDHSPKVGWKKP